MFLLFYHSQLAAQSVQLYSEFQRIDPFGRIVLIDRSVHPREILSPEVPRNAHSVFHVAVTTPENTSYFLYVGSNPANVIETRLYKEEFTRAGEEWIPDGISPIRTPYFGSIPDFTAAIPGQTTRCYLLDIWVPPQVPVQRVRVEVLMKIGIWYVAPLELRIIEARVPQHDEQFSMVNRQLPDVAERIDLPAMQCLADYLLGLPQTWLGGMTNIRDVVRRDAEQDMAIARQHRTIPAPLRLLAADGIVQWWMRNPALPGSERRGVVSARARLDLSEHALTVSYSCRTVRSPSSTERCRRGVSVPACSVRKLRSSVRI